MDNNPGDDDSGKRSPSGDDPSPPKTQSETQMSGQNNNNTTNESESTRNRSRTSLPSFSELVRVIDASRSPRLSPQPPQRTLPLGPDPNLRLTPVFDDFRPIHSPTRVNFPSTSSSPTRPGPSAESTGNWAPRQQGNNALPPGLTTATTSLDTRVDSRNNIASVTTRGGAQYRIPGFQQQPTATPSERIAGSQSRNFQFYLSDRAAPRTYRACTHCRTRKVKCETDPSRDRCRRCIERGLRCSEAIPISPLVGSLLSSERDLAPVSRKQRSESDPILPRNHPSRPAADADTKAHLNELFVDPNTGGFRVPSILQPADPSTSETSNSQQTHTIDISTDPAHSPTSRERHRHTLSSEHRSSHRHDPVGSSERRNKNIARDGRPTLLSDPEVPHPDVRGSSNINARMGPGSQLRPRSFSNPPLRPSTLIHSVLPPDQPSQPTISEEVGPSSAQTPTRRYSIASPPPQSPESTRRDVSPPLFSSTTALPQSFVRTHRRHVASIHQLMPAVTPLENVAGPSSIATSTEVPPLPASESRPLITVIRLHPAESTSIEEESATNQPAVQSDLPETQSNEAGEPIQADLPENSDMKTADQEK